MALVGILATIYHVDHARAVLTRILGGPVMLHPSADGAVWYLTAEVSGDYARLLRLALENNGGGGHPQPALFCPAIRVPLRQKAVARDAR